MTQRGEFTLVSSLVLLILIVVGTARIAASGGAAWVVFLALGLGVVAFRLWVRLRAPRWVEKVFPGDSDRAQP